MQTGKTRWLLALTLALALVAPGRALGEVTQRPGVTQQEPTASPPIQVIRRITVGGAYPTEGEGKRPAQGANKTKATNPNSNRAAKVPSTDKVPPIKVPATPVRSTPILSTPICLTTTQTTPIRATVIRSTPIRYTSGSG